MNALPTPKQTPPEPTRRFQIVGEHRGPRRAAWRQRLVEAERGFAHGIRRDSAFFVYFFIAVVCVTAGMVLGLAFLDWMVLLLAITLVFTVEMFNQMVRSVVEGLPLTSESHLRKTIRLGTAAVYFALAGASLTIGSVFIKRVLEMMPA